MLKKLILAISLVALTILSYSCKSSSVPVITPTINTLVSTTPAILNSTPSMLPTPIPSVTTNETLPVSTELDPPVLPPGVIGTEPAHGPADGATDISLTPVIIWVPIRGATGYDFKIATDSGFTQLVDSKTNINTNVYSPTTALKPNTIYYWEVRARNTTAVGNWFVKSFTTAQTTLPTTPSQALFSPPNGAKGLFLNPNFFWYNVAGATGYDFKLATDAAFTNVIDSQTNLLNNWYAPTMLLKPNTTYYWEVRALSGTQTTDWVTASFTTQP